MKDDDRILIKTPIGNVQAWNAAAGDAALAISWYAHVHDQPNKVAWSSHGLYLSAADARAIAAALIEAADHAERVQIAPAETEAA